MTCFGFKAMYRNRAEERRTARRSASQSQIPFRQKLREMSVLALGDLRTTLLRRHKADSVFLCLDDYDRLLQQYSGRSLDEAKVLEIGYGARPSRLLAMIGMGIDAIGVDLDAPVLHGSFRELIKVYRTNGLERMVKSCVTFWIAGLPQRRALARELKARGGRLRVEDQRFLVGDILDLHVEPQSMDLVVAEDVFEHLPRDTIKAVLPKIRSWLRPGGLALIRPCVFTGISGGHLVEWYPSLINAPRRKPRISEPWEHLRKKRYCANCYLNEMRLSNYREDFLEVFDIVAERVQEPELGARFLTREIRPELAEFDDADLLTNRIMFVLAPR